MACYFKSYLCDLNIFVSNREAGKWIRFVHCMSFWSFYSDKVLWETFRYNWETMSQIIKKNRDLRTKEMCIITLKWCTVPTVELMPFISLEWRCICVLGVGFSSNSRIFHSHGDITINGCKFLPMLVNYGHILSSDGSLACHTYCDTGHPFISML